ncbi:MAG TPA: toprim domain-containing protein, partial [Vicinamibacterales bacterium]|nr:toprim domain-containing protein [Vicinamibacterales bacterium]
MAKTTKKRKRKKTTKRATPSRGRSSAAKTRKASGTVRTPSAKSSTLVVVESPAKARTIARYLDRGFSVKATVGHVRDLPQRELGVEVDKGFRPKYVTIR